MKIRKPFAEDPFKRPANLLHAEVLDGKFKFSSDLPVSKFSNYGDSLWNWFDETDFRHTRAYDAYRLKIDWKWIAESYDIPETIIEDLKKFVFFRYACSSFVFLENRVVQNAHPATLRNELSSFVSFLKHLISQLSEEGFSLIKKLSDIELIDIENALSNYTGAYKHNIRRVFNNLASPILQQYLDCEPLKWTTNDIATLYWGKEYREHYGRLPDDLFRFLSNAATTDVKQFLAAMEIEAVDQTKIGNDKSNMYLKEFPDFEKFFHEYMEKAIYPGDSERHRKDYFIWCNKRKGTVSKISMAISRAHLAAQLLIAMYTGARLSELNSFVNGCLHKDKDGYFLKGTVFKQVRGGPIGEDKWVAIPIVRDALKVLELTSQRSGSEYLFHGFTYETRPIASRSQTFRWWFEKYLRLVDTDSKWANEKIHAYMLRHTLVYQMRKAGLGLPFITHQLKHRFDSVNKLPPNVTLTYGGLDYHAATKAINEANYECYSQIYHPDAPITGGGASEQIERRAAFFEGMAITDIEEVLHRFASQGLPLTDVGIAFCLGQKVKVIDGVKQNPPCIGSLRCNPVRCSNGIIPESKIPAWKRIIEENSKKLKDPEFAHARAYFKEAINEADDVIKFFEKQRHKNNKRSS